MSNPLDAKVSRPEEIAFLVMEDVLGVAVIYHADADGQSGSVDGRWEHGGRVGVVEVTGPPATEEMRRFAKAEKARRSWMEAGSVDAQLGVLAEYLSDQLTVGWAVDNVVKLNRVEAHDRHLYLLGRTIADHEYYARLSDTYVSGESERIGPLVLPEGISDVWYQGRATRGASKLEPVIQYVARYNRASGWSKHAVVLDEQALPKPSIVPDPAPESWRRPPRDRRMPQS